MSDFNLSYSDENGREHDMRIEMRPPTRIQLAWYKHLGVEPPLSTGSSGPETADYARMVPYRHRWFHRAYAMANGFFWLPCPLCDRPFGGHEGGGSIPNPMKPPPDPVSGPWSSLMICSECTREGKAVDV